jgi:tRNA threonylcarbamoyl adenosine modification protein YeaZ
MKILALEFSSPQRSVAVISADAGGNMVASAEAVDTTTGHTMKPFALIESVLRQAGLEREEIECIAVGIGPGSYTGIRAAIALAQGWQLARGVKLLGISSAECLAMQAGAELIARRGGNFCVVIDAQREEFYLADYELDASACLLVAPLRLATLAGVQERERAGRRLVGPEVRRWFPDGQVMFPRAERLARLALARCDFVAGEALEPIYLRETSFVKAPPSRLIL